MYGMIPQLITEQLFNARRCSHLIPWKDSETLVIRICWGKPNRSTQDVPVMSYWKGLTFELCVGKTPTVKQMESKHTKKKEEEEDTPTGKVFKQRSELAAGSPTCLQSGFHSASAAPVWLASSWSNPSLKVTWA